MLCAGDFHTHITMSGAVAFIAARRSYASAVNIIIIIGDRPSVRLSVTRVLCDKPTDFHYV